MAKDPASVLIDTNPSQTPGFYLALGYALAGWQFVEAGLFKVFLKVSTCQNETIAAAIFYAIEDFGKKVEMTRCAIRLLLPDKSPLYADWQKLRKALIDQSEIRNALAHFHVGINATVGQSFELQYQLLSSAGDLMGPPSAAKQKDNHVAIPELPRPSNARCRVWACPSASGCNEIGGHSGTPHQIALSALNFSLGFLDYAMLTTHASQP
jgi:hypothetical protein